MTAIMRRARPPGDNRGHRNFGIVIDGMRMAGFAINVLACAILTSLTRELTTDRRSLRRPKRSPHANRLNDTLAAIDRKTKFQMVGMP
jgi:hypothetical protein